MNKVPRFCGWLSPFEPRPFLTNQNPVSRNQLKTKKWIIISEMDLVWALE